MLRTKLRLLQEAKIAAAISEIGVYEAKITSKGESSVKRQLSTSDESSANTAKKPRTLWTDSDVRRLVQARTLHNNKFQEHNNNMNQKWDIVTDTYNNGSQQSETNTYYSLDLPLEPEEHRTKDVIKHKFEDVLGEFRNIILFEDPSYVANQIKLRVHQGPKKDQAEVETQIMTELKTRKRKFRFYDLMVEFGWHERDVCKPKERLSASGDRFASSSSSSASSSCGSTPAKGSSIEEDGGRQSDGEEDAAGRLGGGKSDGKTGKPPGRPKGAQRNSDAVANLMQAMEKSEQERRNHEKEMTGSLKDLLKEVLAPRAIVQNGGPGWGAPPWAYGWGCPPGSGGGGGWGAPPQGGGGLGGDFPYFH